MDSHDTKARLNKSLRILFFLLLALTITSLALSIATITKENHLFHSGTIKINLNDGNPIIQESEFHFEPGMTVKKDFFIENESSWDVYYRLYFDQVAGDLADILEITIMDGDETLYSGKASDLTKENAGSCITLLHVDERENLSMYFHYPKGADNTGQNRTLSFDLSADAVQTKNNPDALFE